MQKIVKILLKFDKILIKFVQKISPAGQVPIGEKHPPVARGRFSISGPAKPTEPTTLVHYGSQEH